MGYPLKKLFECFFNGVFIRLLRFWAISHLIQKNGAKKEKKIKTLAKERKNKGEYIGLWKKIASKKNRTQ